MIMPNWSFNYYAVKSATGNVLNLVNEGRRNLGMQTKYNIKDAIESLWDGKNNVTMATFRPIPETIVKYGTIKKMERDATDYDTGEPVFNSDEEYETYSRKYEEAVKYNEATYGVTNWREYNCLVGFGCKWDSEVNLKSYDIDNANGITTIYLDSDTAWSYPYRWLKYIKKTFNLNVYIFAQEEFDAYNLYGEIDNINAEYAEECFCDFAPDREDFDSEDEYCDAYAQFKVNLSRALYSKFQECVNGEELDSIYD